MSPRDGIPLSRLTRVGLGGGLATNTSTWSLTTLTDTAGALTLRTGLVILGTAILIYGAMPEQFQSGFAYLFPGEQFEWKNVSVVIIRVAECSRWFFTVVQATRDLNRRWL